MFGWSKARWAWLITGLVMTYQVAAKYFGLPEIPPEVLAVLAWWGLYTPVRESAALSRQLSEARRGG